MITTWTARPTPPPANPPPQTALVSPPSGAGAGLVWVVEGETHYGRGDSLAVAIQLADVDGRADLGVLDGHPAQRDVLAQDGRSGAAGDHADLGPAHVHTVPVPGGLVPVQFEAHERTLGRGLAPLQRGPADEVVFLALQRHGEPDAGLERIHLVAELVPGEDQARLDAQYVEGVQPQRRQ